MNGLQKCPQCGYGNPSKSRFCNQCGEQLLKVSQVQAFALVEGTAGIGKSTLVNNLIYHQMRQNTGLNTLLRLGQGHTYAPFRPDEIDSPLTVEDHLEYLDYLYSILAYLSHPTGVASNVPFMCLIETLHLTLGVRPGLLSTAQILDFDQNLSALGCKLIFIKVSSQTLWERCIWERRKNGFITKYGKKYGQTLEQIHEYYVGEQTRMLELFEQSSMKKMLLNGELPPDEAMTEAYKFWIS